jgi:tetratricopeptide (TPR) repeat protein
VRLQALQGVIRNDEELLRGALERARALGEPVTEAFVAEQYGHLLGRLGQYERTLALFARAIEIHAARGDRLQQALNMSFGGRCYSARAGALERSLQYAAGVRAIAEESNDVRLLALRGMEAEPYYYKGLWEDAVRVAEESLPIGWEIGEGGNMLFASAWLGLAYLKLGRRDDARRVIDRALREGKIRYAGTPFALSFITIARVLAHLADGEVASALALAPQALDLAERSRFGLEQGAAQRALGLAHEAGGDREAAERAFRRSLEILAGIQSRPELGQTLLAYGRFTLAGDPGEGRRLIERARAAFAEIGATGWLAEAEQALGAWGAGISAGSAAR